MWPYPFRCPPATFLVLFTIRINFNNLKRTFRQLFYNIYISWRNKKNYLFELSSHLTRKMYVCKLYIYNYICLNIERIFFKIMKQNLSYTFIIRKIYFESMRNWTRRIFIIEKLISVEKCLCRREEHVSYSRLRPRVRCRMFVSTPTIVWFDSSWKSIFK